MARRKKKSILNSCRRGKIWRAAGYARLSADDGEVGQSGSIVSQFRIIEDWAELHPDVEIVDNFSDDGWSGSNFERPGFKSMMKAVDDGVIDCVIVKDLSRFGRNYIETGRYLERIFPSRGVRLVAVNDVYDGLDVWGGGFESSLAGEVAMMTPFKNLINDFYCAQTSSKTKAALAARRRAGLFVGARAPYGYVKSPYDRNALVIDREAAPVVVRMFEKRAHGETLASIANALNEDGVPTPSELRRMRGEPLNFGCAKSRRDEPIWQPAQVGRILYDRTYTGCLVQGKTVRPSFRQPGCIDVPPEQWTVAKGASPSIVSEELFAFVQRLNEIMRGGGNGPANPLQGLVFCSSCGAQMRLHPSISKGKRYEYYRCSRKCRSVRAELVREAVEDAVGDVSRLTALLRVDRVEVGEGGEVTVLLRSCGWGVA